jgi:hypothetical protein
MAQIHLLFPLSPPAPDASFNARGQQQQPQRFVFINPLFENI